MGLFAKNTAEKRTLLKWIAISVCTVWSTACAPSLNRRPFAVVEGLRSSTSPELTFPAATLTGQVGSAFSFSPTELTNGGAPIASCGIKSGTTAFPAGLSIDSSTCAVSGTPEVPSAATTYTILATNADGHSAEATVQIAIEGWSAELSTTGAPAGRQGASAVWTGTEMIIWGGQNIATVYNTGYKYNPSTDSWTGVTSETNAPAARRYHTAIWDGDEMIIWGGTNNATELQTGGRYNPPTDSWGTAISTTNAPPARQGHVAVFDGDEMIVWGGISGTTYFATGGRYNTATDTWQNHSAASGLHIARAYTSAVWTGSEMIVWGGAYDFSRPYASGLRYNPSTDSWGTPTSLTNAPAARLSHSAVWTGSEMIIWGGDTNNGNIGAYLNSGGRYNPSTDTWTATSTSGAPAARGQHAAAWTGSVMLIFGGTNSANYINDGYSYDPANDTWANNISATNGPTNRFGPCSAWTGSKWFVFGGSHHVSGSLDSGAIWDSNNNTWTATANAAAAGVTGRLKCTAVYTGDEVIVWGGRSNGPYLNDGFRFDVENNAWLGAITTTDAPAIRAAHVAVWTGDEMIVWGGLGASGVYHDGKKYDPETDTWTGSVVAAMPSHRAFASAVWDGEKMIVWGGKDSSNYFDDGFKYSPADESWTEISSTNAPDGRAYHTAIWNGDEMIIWGGFNNTDLSSGYRYNSSSDQWLTLAISSTDAPSARYGACSIWDGDEMIVWGGFSAPNDLSSGGRHLFH